MDREKPVLLAEGEFFGMVPKKRSGTTSVLAEIFHRENASVPEHSHELAYFNLLLDGRYTESYEGKSFILSPMTVIWCPPGVLHRDVYGENGGRIFSMEIRKCALELLRSYVHVPKPFSTTSPRLVSLCLRVLDEFRAWRTCSPMVVEGLTLEMLGTAARAEEVPDSVPPSWLKLVTEKLNEEFKDNISVNHLAQEAGVHPVHLASVFRRFHNKSISEHTQDLRVNHSLELLPDRELPLAEIAMISGFTDQSHFTRIFKRKMGITPGAYRDSLH